MLTIENYVKKNYEYFNKYKGYKCVFSRSHDDKVLYKGVLQNKLLRTNDSFNSDEQLIMKTIIDNAFIGIHKFPMYEKIISIFDDSTTIFKIRLTNNLDELTIKFFKEFIDYEPHAIMNDPHNYIYCHLYIYRQVLTFFRSYYSDLLKDNFIFENLDKIFTNLQDFPV